MNFQIDLNTIIQGIIVASVVYGIKLQLQMSTSITKLETWSIEHSKQDDSRHLDLQESLRKL